jgi:hypothetical protein
VTKRARGLSIDLRKLGDRLPDGVRKAVGRGAKLAAKPIMAADTLMHPEDLLEPFADTAANPIASRRLQGCTVPARAHILGIADLPSIGYEHARHLSITLFRVRVERPDGEVETCVRQHFPREIRRLAPGSSVRALAHADDRRIVVLDWKATSAATSLDLTIPGTLDQYAWPDEPEWPAAGTIEVRDVPRHAARLAERRARWTPARARLADAQPTGANLENRVEVELTLDVDGRRVTVRERTPDLALAKLVGYSEGESKLGGIVTPIDVVANVGAPIAALVSPAGEVAVDWEATLNQPEMRAT